MSADITGPRATAVAPPARRAPAGRGLTGPQVAARVAAGHTNRPPPRTGRSATDILIANVCTRFNALLGALLVVILIVGPAQDALFGLVIVSNTAIGLIQEMRAKRALDRLAVITAPTAQVVRDGERVVIPASEVVLDDVLELHTGDQVVVDAVVLHSDGLELDEALLTGESEPLPKHPGDEVLSGSLVVAGSGLVTATRVGEKAYGAQLVVEARRFTLARSELRSGIDGMLRTITWILIPTALLLAWSQLTRNGNLTDAIRGSVAGTVTMVPEGLVLLTSMAFAVGALRLARRQVLVRELPALEGLARVDTLCIDKTGTLTSGQLRFETFQPLCDAPAEAAIAAVAEADTSPNATMRALQAAWPSAPSGWQSVAAVPFSSTRKFAAVDFGPNGVWLLGAPDVLAPQWCGGAGADALRTATDAGRRVLLLGRTQTLPDPATGSGVGTVEPVALLEFAEQLRADAAQTLAYLAREGITVKVLSGDHPQTVGTLAAQLGVRGADAPVDARSLPEPADAGFDDAIAAGAVFGRVTPAQKRAMVMSLQRAGHVVAMTGDGVNDALALKEADLGIAMGSGTAATRGLAQLVLLDDAFSAVPYIVSEGRRVIANIERVANLFLTKTVYAVALALAVGVAGWPFPFLPRQLTLVSSLTIGIPGFFLALASGAPRAEAGFVGRVLRFAVPAGVVAATATFLAFSVVRAGGGTTLAVARTTATLVLCSVALWVLHLLTRPTNPARQGLIATMGAGLLVSLAVPGLRRFFALELPSPLIWLAGVGVAALAGGGLELGWRLAGWLHRRQLSRRPGARAH